MIKRIAQALGFASILLLPNYIDLTSSAGDERMRSPVPLTRVALAQLADLAIVAIVFFCLMAILRKAGFWPKLRWGMMALFPPFLLIQNLNVFPFNVPHVAVLAASVLWIGLLVFFILRMPGVAARLRLFGSAVLAGFAFFALVVVFQLVRAARWQPGPRAFTAAISAPPSTKPRIVWIIFDELSYKAAFESRDTSLGLPNFDRLRDIGTLYTNVTPIDYWTIHVIPSLLSGRKVTNVAYTPDNRFLVQTRDSPQWHRFDADGALIGMAKQRGMTTSIVGWYLPYCAVFADTATECFWDNHDAEDRGPTLSSASFAANAWFPLRILTEKYFAPRKAWADITAWDSGGHIASVKEVSQHALQIIASSNADLIYIHLPSPHPPAFWDRRSDTFASGGSYLDSLAYTDRILGQVLDLLQNQTRWPATTLIVQGDHSWRTHMWRPQPGWSAEDERISHGGQWDARPLLLIHAAGQENSATVTTPMNLMYVHDFVAGQIEAQGRLAKP